MKSQLILQPIPLFETSAREATGVEDAFQAIAKTALQKGQEDDIYVPETIDLSNTSATKTKQGCCWNPIPTAFWLSL